MLHHVGVNPDASDLAARTERTRLQAQRAMLRAESQRGIGILVGAMRRFVAIEGFDLAGLISIELFLTLLPISIMGFVLFTHNGSVGVGELYVRQLHLSGQDAALVRKTFGNSAELRAELSTWQGVFGFLVWGIPTSLTLSKTFAKAWQTSPPSTGVQLLRGSGWFLLYLLCSLGSDAAGVLVRTHLPRAWWASVAGMAAQVVPLVVLWTLTAPLLVPIASGWWREMGWVGLVSALWLGPVLQAAEVVAYPLVMDWWTEFGPLGVAMTLLTWSMVQATGWVLAACLGAVIVERHGGGDEAAAHAHEHGAFPAEPA